MILVDTSVWVDHLRHVDELLTDLLERKLVVMHPFVIGEVALGYLRPRGVVLNTLRDLRRVNVAHDDEVMRFIEQERLFGLGLGYVDVHLMAAARLTPETSLWTRDKRLAAVAERLSLAAHVTH